MAYNPISGFTLQVITSTGQVASDYYLKFYEANTTTPLSMATDSSGTTLLTKAKIGDKGMPVSNPLDNSTVFIPHVNASYRLVIYTSEADADANNTAEAYVNVPFVSTLLGASGVGTAAYLDTGTAAGEVPTNADLGTAAYLDTGTGADQVPTNGDLPTFGTAAQADTGTAPSEVPRNSDLGTAAQANTGTAPSEVPRNSDLGTAAQANTGTAPSEVPRNSDLGTAATKNTGTATGQIPTADQLSMVGETVNYTGANLNPNVFGGGSVGVVTGGYANSAKIAVFTANIMSNTPPASITVVGTFSVYTAADVLIASGVTPILGNIESNRVVPFVVFGLTGMIAKENLTLRSDTTSSKITVNF